MRHSFKSLLAAANGPLLVPGVFDGVSARLAQEVGFQAAGITGFGIAATFGRPDVGITSLTEMVDRARVIAGSVSIPVWADAEAGFGNPINVFDAVRQFEAAGVAGIHMEDQVSPKKCGSMEGKQIVPVTEMVEKIRAAVAARRDPDFFIIARTDATVTGDWDDAVARCVAYAEAGADAVMPMAPGTPEQMVRFTRAVDVPVVMIMGESEHWVRQNPLLPVERLKELGFSIICFPTSILFTYVQAARRTLRTIMESGTVQPILDQMESFQGVTDLLGLPEIYEMERRFLGRTRGL